MTMLLLALCAALALTLVVEVGLYLLVYGRGSGDVSLVIGVNLITNPLLNFVLWLTAFFSHLNIDIITIGLELVVIGFEGWCYRRFGKNFHHPFLFSVAANACSFGLGWVVQRVLR